MQIVVFFASAWIAAELITGMVHWWEDRYGDPDWPVLGKYVIRPNIEHHSNQTAFTKGNYWTRNWTVLVPSLTAAAVSAAFGQWWLMLVALVVSQGNEIHCWSHQRCSRPIRGLQLLGFLQSPEQHAKHHAQPFDRHYCVMTDAMNPVLQAIQFWQGLEWCVALCGVLPRADRRIA
jgi:ubiquitin-conjugating enzyme E2 variant